MLYPLNSAGFGFTVIQVSLESGPKYVIYAAIYVIWPRDFHGSCTHFLKAEFSLKEKETRKGEEKMKEGDRDRVGSIVIYKYITEGQNKRCSGFASSISVLNSRN